jgi:hypothetical protein
MNDITKWFNLQSKLFQDNAIIVDNRRGSKQVLRIDEIVPSKFVPRMPLSSMNGEDITTPRVCVSLSLMECLAGIGKLMEDVLSFNSYKIDSPFLGGYVISRLDADYLVKPNSKLVPDADVTNEHWLVGFDKDHLEYKPQKLGELFCTDISIAPNTNKSIRDGLVTLKFSVRINQNVDKIHLTSEEVCDLDYFTFCFSFNYNDPIKHNEIVSIVKLSKDEYAELKSRVAGLLSFDLTPKKEIPPSLKW